MSTISPVKMAPYSPEGASSLWNWDLWKSWKSDGEGGKDERRAKITNTDNGEAIDVKTYKREFLKT